MLAGGLQTKASVVTLTMFDIRSGVQIAISEGNSTSTNFGAALGAFGGGGAAGLSGFSRTPEGKATVDAFVDAYNSMVISLRNYKVQEVIGGLGRGRRAQGGPVKPASAPCAAPKSLLWVAFLVAFQQR